MGSKPRKPRLWGGEAHSLQETEGWCIQSSGIAGVGGLGIAGTSLWLRPSRAVGTPPSAHCLPIRCADGTLDPASPDPGWLRK